MNLKEKERTLLSAYLDGELSEKDRARVSLKIATSPEAAHYVESLRGMKSLLRLLPQQKVPHNYTLTRLEAQSGRPGWVFNLLRIVSGVTAAALAAVLAFDFLLPFQQVPMASRVAEDMVMETMPAEESAPKSAEVSEPAILNWYPSSPPGYGIGGGGGGGEGVPELPQGAILPDLAMGPGGQIPQPAAGAPEGELLESAEAPLAMEAEESMDAEGQQSGTGPILGVQPKELQGQTVGGEVVVMEIEQVEPQPAREIPYRVIEIALFVVSLAAAVVAIILRRRKRIS